MRNFQKLRAAIPAPAQWLLCTLVVLAAVLAATVSFGLGTSARTPVNAGAKNGGGTTNRVVETMARTTAETTLGTLPYSGGRLMTADPLGGYWTNTWLGVVTAHGGAPTFGSPSQSGIKLAKPIVGMAATPDGQGYWLVATDGGVFSYGDAKFYGSTGAIHLNQPIVDMEATPDGLGYWLVASDGGVFSFGDAKFYGSTGAIHLNQPIVGMASTPDGLGYWLVASDGGVFTYGDAKFYGSTGAIHLNKPIAGIAPTPDAKGYWLVASDGGIFTFGDAPFSGTAGVSGESITGIVVDPSTAAYTLVEVNGTAVAPTLTPVAAPASGTTPTASSNGAIPTAPASLGAPTSMVLDDEFNTGSLNTGLWSPDWWGSGQVSNGTVMLSSNVSVGANGLALQLNSPQSGGLVSTNPNDDQPGHTGFQIAPTASKPVFVEYKATLPSTASGGVANWPALWLVGQPPWPQNGEIDVMEGGGGSAAYHIHFGDGDGEGADGPGQVVPTTGGTHTFGVLWTTTSETFVYDGAVVGTIDQALDSPMFIVMENSYSSADPTVFPTTMDVRYVRVWN
jgi:hypothetical protein